MSSSDPPWFGDFIGFAGLAMHFLANDPLCDVGEIGRQCGVELLELGPQHPVDEALRCPDYDTLPMHPAISERPKAVAPAERHEQLS